MFVNSSPKRWLPDCDLSFLPLTHVPLTSYSKHTIFLQNIHGRQIAISPSRAQAECGTL